MAGVVFFWENVTDDVFSGTPEAMAAWNHAFKMAGDIDKVIIVDRTRGSVPHLDADVDVQVVEEPPKLENAVHVVCPWNCDKPQPLYEYDHSADWYLFGPAAGWVYGTNGITIPMSGAGALHAVHAANVVMAHRYWSQQWR